MKFLIIFFYLITTGFAHTIEKPNIKNLVLTNNKKTYEEIIFKDKNQKNVNLANYKGKLLLLNFWATWCAPCLEEMPSLDLLQSNKRLNNLKVFPINIGQENLIKSKLFFEKLKIKNLDIYFEHDLNLSKKFLLRGIPTTILINKEGKEFARIVGSIDFSDKKFISWLENFN